MGSLDSRNTGRLLDRCGNQWDFGLLESSNSLCVTSGNIHWEELLYRKFCPFCSYHYNLALVTALESSINLELDPQIKITRVFFAEVDRVLNHLHFAGNFCFNAGSTMYQSFFSAKREITDLIFSITGEAFLPGNTIGGSSIDLRGVGNIVKMLDKVKSIREKSIFWLSKFPKERLSWLDRIKVVDENTCHEFSTTGPLAKSCGISMDARINDPSSCYSVFDFHPVTFDRTITTAYSSIMIRLEELVDSLDLMGEALEFIDKGTIHDSVPGFSGFHGSISAKVESPTGRTICTLQSNSGSDTLYYSLMTPSMINRTSLLNSLDNGTSDKAATIFHCFNLCLCCI